MYLGILLHSSRNPKKNEASFGNHLLLSNRQPQITISVFSPFTALPLSLLSSSLPLYSAHKSKTQVSLLPRVVASKVGGKQEEGSSVETKNKMSNEDFRKLLMEK